MQIMKKILNRRLDVMADWGFQGMQQIQKEKEITIVMLHG